MIEDTDEACLLPITIDHDVLFVPYFASEDAETLDAISRNEPEEIRGIASRHVTSTWPADTFLF